MGLKEEVIREVKRDNERMRRKRIANAKRYEEEEKKDDMLWKIIERLVATVDLSDEECDTYEQIFDCVEKYNIDVSDIIQEYDYEEFKNGFINSRIQWHFGLGKNTRKSYDFHNIDDVLEYEKKYGRIGSIS